MNKRLGTLIAGLCFVAAAEVSMAAIPTPAPKPTPVPCPVWKRCTPQPKVNPCPTNLPCRQDKSGSSWGTSSR